MHTSTNFVLRGGDAAFANRQKLLFEQLSIAENKCNKHDRCEVDNDAEMHVDVDSCNRSSTSRDYVKRRRETRRFSGKESMFKRPEGRAPRTNFRSIPDHHRNPHKWIKYSLADVSNEDMTEQSNTQAAMSFLKELKARRKKETNESDEKMDIEPCDLNTRQDCKGTMFKHKKRTSQIVFTKPQTEETENSQVVVTESSEKPMFRNSKIILPEYVIGQKPKKIPKKKPVVKGDRVKELKLDHLEEPDEEDN